MWSPRAIEIDYCQWKRKRNTLIIWRAAFSWSTRRISLHRCISRQVLVLGCPRWRSLCLLLFFAFSLLPNNTTSQYFYLLSSLHFKACYDQLLFIPSIGITLGAFPLLPCVRYADNVMTLSLTTHIFQALEFWQCLRSRAYILTAPSQFSPSVLQF